MSNTLAAALAVRSDLLPAMISADRAAIHQARCLTAMLEQRQQKKLPVDTAIDEIDMVADTLLKAIAARRSFIQTHHALRDLSERMDMSVCFGPDCPTEVNGADVVAIDSVRAA